MASCRDIVAGFPHYHRIFKVQAAKIKSIGHRGDGSADLLFEGISEPAHFSAEFMDAKKPEAGGYVVRYEKGAVIYIDASSFESAYDLGEVVDCHIDQEDVA